MPLIRFVLLLLPLAIYGQVFNPSVIAVGTNPAGTCAAGLPMRYNTVNGTLWGCDGTWTQVGSGGGGGITIGTTTITGGAPNQVLYDNSGVAGELGLSANLQITGSNLDTIQGIQTSSFPQFASLGIGAAAPNAGSLLTNGVAESSNFPSATIQQVKDNPLSSGATTITVTSTTGWPTAGTLLIKDSTSANSEYVTYTGVTSSTLTGVTRGLYGTTTRSHVQNTNIYPLSFINATSNAVAPDFAVIHWGNSARDTAIISGDISASGSYDPFQVGGRNIALLDGANSQITAGGFALNGGVFTAIGTNSVYVRAPGASQSVNIADNNAATVNIGSSTGATIIGGASLQAKHVLPGGTAPTIASGFGSSPSIVDGGDSSFRVNVGTGGSATSGVVTFAVSYATAPHCVADDESTILLVQATATTTNVTLTASSAFGASDKLSVVCH